MEKSVFKSVSDERLVIDILAPGYGKDAITVKTAKVNGGENFKVVVEGKYIGRKNKDGVAIPKLGFEKYVEDFKYVFSDDSDFGEELFRSRTFNTLDYDLTSTTYDVRDGVIRISIAKTKDAKGSVVKSVANADADSTGVITSDAE